MSVKFLKHCVKSTETGIKARVWYSLDNRSDGRKVVTIYAKDYDRALGKVFADGSYENKTDSMTDYFDQGTVRLFEDHPLYKEARKFVEGLRG